MRRLCEQQLGCRVVPELASAAAIARARRRAYRRLVEDEAVAGTQPLGETLVAEGHLSADLLPALLEEQRDTGERLGELLVRKGLVRPELIAGALRARSRTERLGYRPVRPDEVDVDRLRLLGYGLCAFYGVVPLTGSAPGKPVVLASASPVHPLVLERCAGAAGRAGGGGAGAGAEPARGPGRRGDCRLAGGPRDRPAAGWTAPSCACWPRSRPSPPR